MPKVSELSVSSKLFNESNLRILSDSPWFKPRTTPTGFEPVLTASKAAVLPLHQGALLRLTGLEPVQPGLKVQCSAN